jgi:hypothetical protein
MTETHFAWVLRHLFLGAMEDLEQILRNGLILNPFGMILYGLISKLIYSSLKKICGAGDGTRASCRAGQVLCHQATREQVF